MPHIHFSALSERGLSALNEDSYCAQRIGSYFVFAIADGMTGHLAGRTASDIAIACLRKAFEDNPRSPGSALESAVRTAETQIRSRSEHFREKSGMATKLTACIIDEKFHCTVMDIDNHNVAVINSEGIRSASGSLAIQSPPGSAGTPPATPHHHALSDMISHVLGEPQVIEKNDFVEFNIQDSFILLSSDGLHDYLKGDTIRETILRNGDNLEISCEELIQKALSAGSEATITSVLIHVLRDD